MEDQTSLADLLCLLLGLPDRTAIHATSGFRPWLQDDSADPTPPEGSGGLWLLDTRDRQARRLLRRWKTGTPPGFRAALILTRAAGASTRFSVRAVLRHIRNRGRRVDEKRVHPLLADLEPNSSVQRLGFRDEPLAPTSFHLRDPSQFDGAAFLLTRDATIPAGPVRNSLLRHLDTPDPALLDLHMRDRGAAVLVLNAADREVVVRVVPDPRLRLVVDRNHRSLNELRARLEHFPSLLSVMPVPLFRESREDFLLMGETRLPGTLAWRVAHGERARAIKDNVLELLDRLRIATTAQQTLSSSVMQQLLIEDRERVMHSPIVDRKLSIRILEEFDAATVALKDRVRGHTSHGDFGYGNVLVDPESADIRGVIDWDTARVLDFPGVDRINLEIQIRRGMHGESFPTAARSAWEQPSLHESLSAATGLTVVRPLFALALCRYIIRALPYPQVYREEARGFGQALEWLAHIE